MHRNTRRGSLVGLSVVAVVIVASSVAWACSPAARIDCANASSKEGPPGTRVLITGCSFYNDQPVEIHWDVITARPLTTATGPEFSVGVNVPASATAGNHKFLVVFRDTNANSVRLERWQEFVVTPGERQVAGPNAVIASGGSGGEGDVPATPAPGTQPTNPAVQQPVTPAGPGAPTAAAPGTQGVPSSASNPSAAAASGKPAPALPTASPSANSGAVRNPAGRVVFGGSTPSVAAAQGAAAPIPASDEAAQTAVSPRAAAGDLWSGFQSTGEPPAFGLETGTTGAGSGPGAPVGVALFVAALMALLGGFGAAELGRRRALAHAGDRTHTS